MRWLAVLAFALVAAALLSGCGRGAAAESHAVRLRAWTMWGGDEAKAFQAVVDTFNREHPAIRVENLPSTDDPRIIRAIVADDPPEIFTCADPSYLGSLAGNGAIRPLDEEFRGAGLREDDFAPASLSQCRYGGRLYAMIYLEDCFGLLWNPDLFAEAGLDPERPPATLDELRDYARRLTVRDESGHIRRLGIKPPDPLIVMAAYGGRFVDPATGRPTADDPRNREALEWYRSLIRAQGSPEEVNAFSEGFGKEQGINNPFLLRKAAMTINGQWNPYWFQRYGPAVPYRAGPVPYPDRHPEMRRPTWLGGNLFCIPRNCRRPREAWEFLRWTQTYPAQVLFASTMHGVPNLLQARRERSLRQGEPWKRWFGVYMDIATSPNARHFPVTPVSGLYQYELNNAADFVRFCSREPAEALADVQTRVSREMSLWLR